MIIKKIVCIALSVIMMCSISITSFAENVDENQANESSAPFVLAATGDKGNINISCSNLELFGDLSSTNKINIWASTIKDNGLKTEDDSTVVLNSFKDELSNYEYVKFNDIHTSNVKCTEENPIKCDKYSNSSSEINIHSVINSKNGIELSARNIIANEDNDQYLFSENGDINISCENFKFSGIIYAPNGSVNISANNININGFIIANNLTFNANKIVIKEDYELYTKYENIDKEAQEEDEKLIEEYLNTVDELNNATDNEDIDVQEQKELENKYDELHEQLEDKEMLLSEEETKEFFESEYEKANGSETENSNTNNLKMRKASKFKPCAGIEKLYDVIRKQSTCSYKKKSYSYYSMTVCDKVKAKNVKFTEIWNDSLTVTGKITDKSQAKAYLNKAFQVTFGKAAGNLVSSLGRPVAGSLVSTALSQIYPFGKPSVSDLVVKSKAFHTVNGIQVSTKWRYYWVKYDNRWQMAYSCNFARWEMIHIFYRYNGKKHKYEHDISEEVIKLNGTFSKPVVAVQTIVDYKKMYGKYANNGYYPYGWNKTPDLTIKDYKGKKHTYKTPSFPSTTSLI